MNVYFSTSASSITDNIEACRVIIDTIKQSGHNVTKDWVEEAYERSLQNRKLNKQESSAIYEENLRALDISDVVIIEASANTFNSGYLSGKAINLQKPLLVVTNNVSAKPTFISGETTSLKHVEIYDGMESLRNIVSRFLDDNDSSTNDVRFNMYIGRNISNYLKRASKIQGKTKAQIVREIINEHISNNNGI